MEPKSRELAGLGEVGVVIRNRYTEQEYAWGRSPLCVRGYPGPGKGM